MSGHYPGLSLNSIVQHIQDVHADWGAEKRINLAAIRKNKSLAAEKAPNLMDGSPLPKYEPTPRDSSGLDTPRIEMNHDVRTHFCE